MTEINGAAAEEAGSAARRRWLTEPGESLLISSSAVQDLSRADEFDVESGLGARQTLVSRLCSVPLPTPGLPRGDGNRPWAGVRPEFMWHPYAWLPERFRKRLPVPGVTHTETGEQAYETDDMFAARVAMELSALGVYDIESGTWLDVLSLVGIDTRTTEGSERVGAWLVGEYDFDLDTVDISEFVTNPPGTDPDWAISIADSMYDELSAGAAHLAAMDLLDVLGSTEEPDDDPAFDVHTVEIAASYAFCGFSPAVAEGWRTDIWPPGRHHSSRIAERTRELQERLQAIADRSQEPFDAVVEFFAGQEPGEVDTAAG